MSRFNLETAIAHWRRQYATRHTFSSADIDELERHLRDQVAWLMERGSEEESAFRKAVADLGSVFEAEDEFRKVFWKKLRFQRGTMNELMWRLSMIGRYLQVGTRSMMRQKAVNFINVFGLSVALASCICVYIFLDSYVGMDDFHENGERIWLVSHTIDREGESQMWGQAPLALASSIDGQIPGVEEVVRMTWEWGRVLADDTVFEGPVQFVDPAYLDILTFAVDAGPDNPLVQPDGAAITADAATKYFGDKDPIGEPIHFMIDGVGRVDLTIRSVLAPLPGASGTRFEILAPMSNLISVRGLDESDWQEWINGTLILTSPGTNPRSVEASLNNLISIQNAANPDWLMTSFFLDNLRHSVEQAYRINNRALEAPHPAFIVILLLIPLSLLLLSVFNYVNIAVGAAERRLREIGVRKVSGGSRGQLVSQFLVENLVVCSVSLALAGLISWLFLLPMFDEIFVYALTWEPVTTGTFWIVMLGILFGTSLISGAYPALYVSSFEPVTVFRGRQALPGRRIFSHVFLAVQFTIAFFCILIGMYMTFGGDFVAEDGWGYEPDRVVTVRMESSDLYGPFRDQIEGLASVDLVSPAVDHIGSSHPRTTVTLEGNDHVVGHLRVGADYFATLGLPVREGRGFDADYGADVGSNVVVNAAFVREFGWEEPIGQGFAVDSTSYQVVGVVDNPILHPLNRYRPVFFSRVEEEAGLYAVVRSAGSDTESLMAELEAVWTDVYPDVPYDAYLQRTVFDVHVESWNNLSNAIRWLAALALLISCMGLFGLASQGVAARMKEISIRKVLGANPAAVALRVHTKYLILISIGAAISMPIVYAGLVAGIRFADLYHMTVDPSIFVASYIMVVGVAFVSIGNHAWRMMRVNPAVTLRGD